MAKIERYILFGGDSEPEYWGGWGDFIASSNKIAHLKMIASKHQYSQAGEIVFVTNTYTWWHIVDTKTGEIVEKVNWTD